MRRVHATIGVLLVLAVVLVGAVIVVRVLPAMRRADADSTLAAAVTPSGGTLAPILPAPVEPTSPAAVAPVSPAPVEIAPSPAGSSAPTVPAAPVLVEPTPAPAALPTITPAPGPTTVPEPTRPITPTAAPTLVMADPETPLYDIDDTGAMTSTLWTGFLGQVLDAQDRPLAGVPLIVWAAEPAGSPASPVIETDATGSYEIRLAAGPAAGAWSIQVLTADWRPASRLQTFYTGGDVDSGVQHIWVVWKQVP